MPRVSLIVPVYNVERYLEQCLRSAMAQTERDIEIIVVNDGSPDGSQAIIDRLAAEDSRIVPVVQENGGYGRAINNGLSRATGEYLFILESDDWIDPFALEVLLDRAGRAPYDIIKGGFMREFADGSSGRYSLERLTNRYEGEVRVLENPRVMTMESSIWSALYRAEFIRDQGITMLESTGAAYQDLVWKFMTFALASRVYFVDYPVYHYRVLAIGSSSRNNKNPLAHFYNYEHLRRELESRGRFIGDVVGLYYAHNLIDFNFHLGRLGDEGRREFAIKGREVLEEIRAYIAESGELTTEPAFDLWVRAYTRDSIRFVTGRSASAFWRAAGQLPVRRRAKNLVKRLLVGTIGRASRVPLAGRVLDVYRRAVRASRGENPSASVATLPAISMPQGFAGRNVLVVIPWSDENGSTRIIDLVNEAFKALGYKIHVVVYNDTGRNPGRDGWTYFYDLPHAVEFGRLHYHHGELVPDGNTVDEWAGDDLAQFVRSLDAAWRFDAVVCHYVFLSRVLDYVGDDATKILITHDRFAGRNTRFAERGMTDSHFFSTSEDQEALGLRRADHVIALQEGEAQYFRGLLKETGVEVHTLPIFDAPRFLPDRDRSGPLLVGFIGSTYVNNKTAITQFFEEVGRDVPPSLKFVVAGRVCRILKHGDLPHGVRVMGDVDDLREFYESVDVVFNPDFFESGRKIKVFEGLSFGVPVVTTRQATAGFDDLPADMKLESNAAILSRLVELAIAPDALDDARRTAKETYLALYGAHSTEGTLRSMLGIRARAAR